MLQGLVLPACAALNRAGPDSAGSGRWASIRLKRRGGPCAARASQERAEAPRPPLGPHCIRGKKLRCDVPLLPALPAPADCHRDIASPLHGALLSRPTCPPTATEGPSKLDELETDCGAQRCPPERQDDVDQGRTLQTLANVGLGVGIGGIVIGSALIIFGGPSEVEQSAAFAPSIEAGPDGAALRFRGSF